MTKDGRNMLQKVRWQVTYTDDQGEERRTGGTARILDMKDFRTNLLKLFDIPGKRKMSSLSLKHLPSDDDDDVPQSMRDLPGPETRFVFNEQSGEFVEVTIPGGYPVPAVLAALPAPPPKEPEKVPVYEFCQPPLVQTTPKLIFPKEKNLYSLIEKGVADG